MNSLACAKTLSGKAEYKEYLSIPCYVIFFFSSSWFYKTIRPRPEPLIPGSERNIWLLHPHRIGREMARGKHGAQSSRFDCQMRRMAGLEWAWGPALWILFIALPSNAKRNFECSSCIFNMKLVSQMFLQTFFCLIKEVRLFFNKPTSPVVMRVDYGTHQCCFDVTRDWQEQQLERQDHRMQTQQHLYATLCIEIHDAVARKH